MAIQDNKRLRQLISDYYHGLITPESYREQRAKLLDNLGADVTEQPDTVTREQRTAREDLAESRPPPVPQDKSSGSGSRTKPLVIGAVVLGGIAAATYVIFVQDFGSGRTTDATAISGEVVEERSSKFGDSLLEDFLVRNDWSTDSLNNFLLAWNSLDDVERHNSTESRYYRRLRLRLHQRIGEEAILSDVASNGQLQALTDFAVKIGAPYRESQVADTDEMETPDVLPEVGIGDEAQLVSTDSDVPEVDEVESAPAAATSADETEKPVEDAVRQPDPGLSTATEAAAIVDDPCPAEIANTRRPYCRDALNDGDTGPSLVVLPTGSYEMGSGDFDSESPRHRVEITDYIAMSQYEISAAEYGHFCAATNLICADNDWSGDHPVVSISWDDAVLYTEWLSENTGFRYRLPTEAEWEYAARAGTDSPYYFGDEITPSAAHSSANGPVDSPMPSSDRSVNRNPFRLYHMSGNVREWTQDAWHPNYDNAPLDGSARLSDAESLRVVRGGSYSDPGAKLRSAAREPLDRSHRDGATGFRVVREISPQAADN